MREDFCCLACPAKESKSFYTFKEVREHAHANHGVILEEAIQGCTVLPTYLFMYCCRLCGKVLKGAYEDEDIMYDHIKNHSSFFLKCIYKYIQTKCRVCNLDIDTQDIDEHFHDKHPVTGFAKSIYSQVENKSTSSTGSKNSDNCHRKVSRSPGADGSVSMKIVIKNELKDSAEIGCGSKQDVRQYLVTNINAMVKEEPVDVVSIMNNNHEIDKYERQSCSQEIDPTAPLVAVNNMMDVQDVKTEDASGRIKSKIISNLKLKKSAANHDKMRPCILCGDIISVKDFNCHNIARHQDMMFKCMVGSCRYSDHNYGMSSFIFPNHLNNHHRICHKLSKRISLDVSKSKTKLPSRLLKISCSLCKTFIMFPDIRHMMKHLWGKHGRRSESDLIFECNVCMKSFQSIEAVYRHSVSHYDPTPLGENNKYKKPSNYAVNNSRLQRSSKKHFVDSTVSRKVSPSCNSVRCSSPTDKYSSSESNRYCSRSPERRVSGYRYRHSSNRNVHEGRRLSPSTRRYDTKIVEKRKHFDSDRVNLYQSKSTDGERPLKRRKNH